jgi:hypothetical protein
MHPQTWTGKDSGEAAFVVSYQQSCDKKNMTMYLCTTQNRNPLKPQVKFRNMDISYKSQSKSLGMYHVSHHIWNEIKGLCENTKLKLSEACYIIKSLKEVMIPQAIMCIFCAPCYAHLRYGLIFWSQGYISKRIFNCKWGLCELAVMQRSTLFVGRCSGILIYCQWLLYMSLKYYALWKKQNLEQNVEVHNYIAQKNGSQHPVL